MSLAAIKRQLAENGFGAFRAVAVVGGILCSIEGAIAAFFTAKKFFELRKHEERR